MMIPKKMMALVVAIASLSAAPAAMADVFEVVSAPIADGVSVEQMASVDAAVGAFIATLPGFISRETGVSVKEEGISPGNEWYVIVRWDTIENAKAAAQALNAKPEISGPMMSSMKSEQVFFRHFEIN